jgi:hypothetical protein
MYGGVGGGEGNNPAYPIVECGSPHPRPFSHVVGEGCLMRKITLTKSSGLNFFIDSFLDLECDR